MPGGTFDLLTTLMGRPPPSMALAAGLGQAPGQPGGPPTPLPGAPAPGGQGGGAAPTPSGGAAPAGASQTPQAFQSPPDLSQMYLQLAQRSQAEQNFNNGIAGLVASIYPGRTSSGLISALRGNVQDPGETFRNLIALQQASQQQQNLAAYRTGVPDMLKSMGLNDDEIKAYTPLAMADPAFAEKIAETKLGVGGGPAWMAQLRAEKALTAAGQPIPWTPGDPTSYDAWTKANATQKVAEAKDAQSDRDAFTAADGDYRQTEQMLGWLKAHPEATAAAVQNGAFAAGRTGQFRQWLGSLPGGLPPDTATAAGFIGQLQGKLYSDAWKGRGGRLSQLEAGKISQGFSQLDNPAMPADQITQQISSLYDKTLTSHANTYGAAGMPTPGPYYGYMDDQYKKNGKIDRGATELSQTGTGSAAGIPAPWGSSATAAAPHAPPAAGGAQAAPAPVDLRNSKDPQADYEKLNKGDLYTAPDGQTRRKG